MSNAPGASSEWSLQTLTRRLSVADLPEQFVLAEEPSGPPAWPVESIGQWTLRRHPTLPRITLRDANDSDVGWLLGYPVVEGGALLVDGDRLGPVPQEPKGLHDFFDLIGGRWLAILTVGAHPRVFLDATGSLSAVFVPSQRVVASTPSLVAYESGLDDRTDLAEAMGLPWSKTASFPLGMTSRRGVWRLLPNHHLDLISFTSRRHWPTGPWDEDPDIGVAVERIVELTRRNALAVMAQRPGLMPLTAGRDSRTVLAALRESAAELAFYTIRFADYQGEVDAWVASRMSAALGLNHRVVPLQPPRRGDLEEWLLRVGCSVGEVRGWQASTSVKSLGSESVTLTANIGEIARGRRWLPTDRRDTVVTPERLLGHSKAPVTDETISVAQDWLAGVPLSNALQVLSLFYVEETLGSWAGVIPYAEYAGPGFTILPMNHTEIVRRMLALPEQFQRDRGLASAVIESQWPELLRWPFNEEYGWRRVRRRLRQQVRRMIG